jgi:hypothetical protein
LNSDAKYFYKEITEYKEICCHFESSDKSGHLPRNVMAITEPLSAKKDLHTKSIIYH